GISLAIYSFMQNLRVEKDTYLYAVCVGEHLDYESTTHFKIIEQFRRVIEKKGLNRKADIFVRCKGIRREVSKTDENIFDIGSEKTPEERISIILDGLLYHSFDDLKNKPRIEKQYNEFGLNYGYSFEKTGRTKAKLNNIYLDDSMFAGVRFSKVI
ncbi:MAG: hypothetical protein IJ054_00610, partial [Lachnospiraceae bacterium]|nr:hypothetical protein [Lachnospiraceae bacterium]